MRAKMHVIELPNLDPLTAAERLRPLGGLAWLDSAMGHPELGRWSFVAADPFAVFEVRGGRATWNGEPVEGHPLAVLKERLSAYATPAMDGLPPFQGGAIGFFSYEFGRWLDRLGTVDRAGSPRLEARLQFHDVVIGFDRANGRSVLMSAGWPEARRADRARRAAHRAELVLDALSKNPLSSNSCGTLDGPFASNFDRAGFEAAVRRTVEYVLAGDIFQANIAQRFAAPLPSDFDPLAFYRRLRQLNPAPFAAYLEGGDITVASSSPERFVTVAGGRVEARPIKGTIARSPDPLENGRLAAALLASEKDRAENVMIVDLLRNDLSRVCKPHSVRVPKLAGLESYASVHHLVSVVEGELKEGLGVTDLVAAAFPGGSITGAPKIRASEIIAELEGVERGVYCGSIGWLGFSGDADLNIAIRTVQFAGGEAVVHAGGGITALSHPAAEYDETMLKAARVLAAFRPEERP